MIRVGSFTGEVPKVRPRYLPDNGAQLAFNVRLDDGALTPIRQGRLVHTLSEAAAATIYRHKDVWYSWPVPVNVVPGPVDDDRLYITGNGKPQIRVDGNLWDLAIRAPSAPPTIDQEGTLDEDLFETVVYAYTFVTELGEESEPSLLSEAVQWSQGMTNVLTGFDPDPPARVKRMRIYRSQSGQTSPAGLYFIKERAYTVAPFIDNWGGNPIVEPIPSVAFNPPPDELQGIIPLPNGMMAGFVGKRLYFSEPYIPHAWPEKYVLTMDYPIVGLGAFGSSLAVMTTGHPYVVTGTAPENMVSEKLELNLPCVSARSIVDLGYSVAYASHDGLVTISNNGAVLITREVIGREEWQRLQPGGMTAGQYSGKYMASYAYQDAQGLEQRGSIIIDVAAQTPFVSRTADFADDMFYEIQSGDLFLLRNGAEIWQWDAAGAPNGELVWRSKPFVLDGETSFAFIRIEAEAGADLAQRQAIEQRIAAVRAHNRALLDGGGPGGALGASPLAGLTFAGDRLLEAEDLGYDALAVTVYGDGQEVATIYTMNATVRLPARTMYRTWEIEVRGNLRVEGIAMGHAPSQLAVGG